MSTENKQAANETESFELEMKSELSPEWRGVQYYESIEEARMRAEKWRREDAERKLAVQWQYRIVRVRVTREVVE